MWDYIYDLRNQMTEAQELTSAGGSVLQTIDYAYDVYGNMVKRDFANGFLSTHQKFAYDITDVSPGFTTSVHAIWAELNGSGSLITRYLTVGSNPIARSDSSTAYWLLADRIGSVREVTDGSGSIVSAISYTTFGGLLSETNSALSGNVLFTGGMFDRLTGLYGMHWRSYDPASGQWTSEDPIGFVAGDANLRRYVGNGATNGVDRNGLEWKQQSVDQKTYTDLGGPKTLPPKPFFDTDSLSKREIELLTRVFADALLAMSEAIRKAEAFEMSQKEKWGPDFNARLQIVFDVDSDASDKSTAQRKKIISTLRQIAGQSSNVWVLRNPRLDENKSGLYAVSLNTKPKKDNANGYPVVEGANLPEGGIMLGKNFFNLLTYQEQVKFIIHELCHTLPKDSWMSDDVKGTKRVYTQVQFYAEHQPKNNAPRLSTSRNVEDNPNVKFEIVPSFGSDRINLPDAYGEFVAGSIRLLPKLFFKDAFSTK